MIQHDKFPRGAVALIFAITGLVGVAACDAEPSETEQFVERSQAEIDELLEAPDATVESELTRLAAPDGIGEPILALEPDPYEPPLPPDLLGDFYIEDISTGGTGCPNPYTVTSVISGDRRSFLLLFDEMQIEYPPGPQIQNKTCSAAISLHVPQGYQLALATVNTRGYAYLDPGIRARQTSKYFFAGYPIAFAPRSALKGPFDDLYDFTDKVPFESLVWSPCGGSAIFGIQSIINVNAKFNPYGTAIFSNDTIDGRFQQLYNIRWREC